MTNYLIIKKILREADRALSIKTIKSRAEDKGYDMHRETISSLLNKMESKDVAKSEPEQVSKRRIKFWELV